MRRKTERAAELARMICSLAQSARRRVDALDSLHRAPSHSERDDRLDQLLIADPRLERGLGELLLARDLRVRVGLDEEGSAIRAEPEVQTRISVERQVPIDALRRGDELRTHRRID